MNLKGFPFEPFEGKFIPDGEGGGSGPAPG